MTTTKPLFIGMEPPPGADPTTHRPLFPYPRNSAGGRLQKLTGLSLHEYLKRTCRVNLFPEHPGHAWPVARASHLAAYLRDSGLLEDRKVVCVGPRVYKAFFPGQRDEDIEDARCSLHGTRGHFGIRFQIGWIPHTSGRNLWYNDAANIQQVTDFLQSVCSGE